MGGHVSIPIQVGAKNGRAGALDRRSGRWWWCACAWYASADEWRALAGLQAGEVSGEGDISEFVALARKEVQALKDQLHKAQQREQTLRKQLEDFQSAAETRVGARCCCRGAAGADCAAGGGRCTPMHGGMRCVPASHAALPWPAQGSLRQP
jgi:hypothetical protein